MNGSIKLMRYFSFSAFFLGFAFLFIQTFPEDESMDLGRIISCGIGYWLWLASMAIACLASLLMRDKKRIMLPKEQSPT